MANYLYIITNIPEGYWVVRGNYKPLVDTPTPQCNDGWCHKTLVGARLHQSTLRLKRADDVPSPKILKFEAKKPFKYVGEVQ